MPNHLKNSLHKYAQFWSPRNNSPELQMASVLPTLTKKPLSYLMFWVCSMNWYLTCKELIPWTWYKHQIVLPFNQSPLCNTHLAITETHLVERNSFWKVIPETGCEARFVRPTFSPSSLSILWKLLQNIPSFYMQFLYYHCLLHLPIFYSEYQSPSDAVLVTFPSSPIPYKASCPLCTEIRHVTHLWSPTELHSLPPCLLPIFFTFQFIYLIPLASLLCLSLLQHSCTWMITHFPASSSIFVALPTHVQLCSSLFHQ